MQPPPPLDPSRRTLWLVRHGESTWNALGLVQGQVAGPGLTGRGRTQARRVAALLAGRPVDALYSSDLRRAVESARPLAAAFALPLVQDARLRERGFGVAEGTPARALAPQRSGIAAGRVVDADAAPTGGESVRQLCRRVGGFLDELAGDGRGGDVVLVVHGGVVRAAVTHLDGVQPEDMAWDPLDNAVVVRRSLPRSPWQVTAPVVAALQAADAR